MPLTSLKAKSMNAAKQAKYTPQQMTIGLNNGRWARFYAAVDAEASANGETLTPAERERRAHNKMLAQVYAMIDAREMKRKAKKARDAADARYLAERNAMPHGCLWCGPIPPGAIDIPCATHVTEQRALMQRH